MPLIVVFRRIVLLLMTAIPVVGYAQATADELFKKGDAIRVANPDSAIICYHLAAKKYALLKLYEKEVSSLNQSGTLLNRKDKPDEAIKDLNLALRKGTAYLGKNNLAVATTYITLGVAYNAKKEYLKSLGMHHKALNIRLIRSGKINADVATSYGNIGNVYLNYGDIDKAIENHNEALKIRKEVFGNESPELVQSYVNLGRALKENKMYQGALGSYKSAMDIRLKQADGSRKDLPVIYKSISDLYFLTGNDEQGKLFKEKSEKEAGL